MPEPEKIDNQNQKPQDGATPNPNAKPENPPNQKPDAKAGSLYSDVGLEEPGKNGSTTWPDTWRDDMAKGLDDQAKASELLKRYDSPAAIAKALVAAQQRIRSGEYRRNAPASDDPKAIEEWRRESGMGVKPEDYTIPPVAGIDFDKLDPKTQEKLGGVRQLFLESNLTIDQGNKIAGAMISIAEKQMEEEAAGDAAAMNSAEDTLRADWGRDFRVNLQMNMAHLEKEFGADLADAILLARTPDGRRLADSPEFSKAINKWARSQGSDIMLDGEGGPAKSVAGRIAEIKKIMDTDFGRYQAEFAGEYSNLLAEAERRGLKID